MVVEMLAKQAELRRLTVSEVRDGLVLWFVERAEPQLRRAMAYTAPGASDQEVRRALLLRARTFFAGLASTFDDPTWADLRRVKQRMATYLLPERGVRQAVRREIEHWDLLLAGPLPQRHLTV